MGHLVPRVWRFSGNEIGFRAAKQSFSATTTRPKLFFFCFPLELARLPHPAAQDQLGPSGAEWAGYGIFVFKIAKDVGRRGARSFERLILHKALEDLWFSNSQTYESKGQNSYQIDDALARRTRDSWKMLKRGRSRGKWTLEIKGGMALSSVHRYSPVLGHLELMTARAIAIRR